MSDWLQREQFTRPGPFGLVINVRRLRATRVTTLTFGIGHTHAVDGGFLEWVTGAPELQFRYTLACGSARDQQGYGVKICTTPSPPITCPKCKNRLRNKEKK